MHTSVDLFLELLFGTSISLAFHLIDRQNRAIVENYDFFGETVFAQTAYLEPGSGRIKYLILFEKTLWNFEKNKKFDRK